MDFNAQTWHTTYKLHTYIYTLLEIRSRNWLAVLLKIAYVSYRLLIAIPLKMYRKFGRLKWILVSQMLKLFGKCPMADCYLILALYTHVGVINSHSFHNSNDWSLKVSKSLTVKSVVSLMAFSGTTQPNNLICYFVKQWFSNFSIKGVT